ncbi:MAG: cytosine permease [Vicinamibacterales bacterium]
MKAAQDQTADSINLEDAVGRVEKRGIEFIPEESRHSSPRNLTWVWIGSQMTFGVILLGWLPIAFGLGWWDAVTSMTAGLAFGIAFFGWFSLIGPRTGTNSAVSSGAHFGVVGRLVGSFQALFIAIGYAAITVWVSGDMLVTGLHELFGLSNGNESRAIAYAIVSLAMILVAVFGHANVVAVQKVVAIIVVIILVVAVFVLLPQFDAGYAGSGEYLLGGYWPTWIFSAVIAAQLPISYTPFANDFARYVSTKKWKDNKTFWGASIGMFVGCWIALVFGAYADTIACGDGVIAISPTWFVLPLLVVGLLGSFAQGSLALYGTGLDTSSIIPGLKRVPATLALSAVALVFVYFGAFVWNAIDAVSAFILILLVLVVPWMVISLIGLLYNRGRYWPADLQVFNLNAKGGAYWYTGGVNWRAAAGYVLGVVAGLLYVYTTIFVGPLADSVGGVDVSIFSSGIVAGIVYAVLLWAFPERNHPKAGETGLASSVPVVARSRAE